MEKLAILAQIRNVEMEKLQTVRRQRDHIALQNSRMEKALEVLMKNKENQ